MRDFAIYESKIGYIFIQYEDDVATYVKKLLVESVENFGNKTPFTDFVFEELSDYFDGKRKDFTFKYILEGTDFQVKVWNALLKIPYGETRSYKDIAITIGNEKACRAVGMANNRNPISYAVP